MFYRNRDKLQKISVKTGIIFSRIGLTPNQWTFSAAIPALAGFYFLVDGDFILASVFFLASFFIDLVDGAVAKVTGKETKRGAYFDTIMDRYVEFLVLFGFILIELPAFVLPSTAWIMLTLFGSFMTTYAKAAASEKKIVEKELKGGLLERAERLILLFIGVLAAAFNPLYLVYVLIVLSFLTNVTALQRMYYALRG
ncbi:MAG: CDP-alcohol phosphatidyltransferase family protein [Candidatus Altiarchaeales archaeon]|nr:CDP-alcohol phosphatidyltransferase family protein [Candidatus Altiarchaeales archaeon]